MRAALATDGDPSTGLYTDRIKLSQRSRGLLFAKLNVCLNRKKSRFQSCTVKTISLNGSVGIEWVTILSVPSVFDWPEPEETFLGTLSRQNKVGNGLKCELYPFTPADVDTRRTSIRLLELKRPRSAAKWEMNSTSCFNARLPDCSLDILL